MTRVRGSAQKRLRKYDKSHAEIILKVRQYFELERRQKKIMNVQQVVQRTAAATGAGKNIVSLIRTEEDVRNWARESGESVNVKRESQVPYKHCALVRQVVRDEFLQKKSVPTLDSLYQKLVQLQVKDVAHLNLFDDINIAEEEIQVWTWCRATLHRFMRSIGFVYGDRITHYEHTKKRLDVISMRHSYLDWIHNYRQSGFRIYYQDETWVFKNMTCSKI